MSRLKSFYTVFLILITLSVSMTGLEAQEIEEDRSPIEEFIRRAEHHVELNQLEQAIEIYERIVIAAPDDTYSQRRLATLYSQTNQHEQAIKTYSKLLEANTENLAYQDGIVSSLRAAGKNKEALDFVLEYIQTEPENGVHYARIANLYEMDGNEAAAIANYNKATELGYENIHTYLRLARLNFFNMDMDATENALKKASLFTTSDSTRQELERQLIYLYRFNGNLELKVQEAKEVGTMNFAMQKLIAENLHKNGELEKAVEAYYKARDVTANANEKTEISGELLKLYVDLGKIESVIEPYERQVHLQVDNKTYTRNLNTPVFIAVYIRETARDSLIDAFKTQDKLDVLRTHYENKLAENKDNPVLLTIMAKIYWEEKDYQKSAEMFEALGRLNPINVHYLYYAAAALQKSHQPELAKEMLNQAKIALADNPERNDMQLLGSLATICIENRMYETAIELSKTAIDLNLSDVDRTILDTLHVILAKSYRRTGRYKEAVETYQQLADNTRSNSNHNMEEKAIHAIAKEGKLYEEWIPLQINKLEKSPNDPNLILTLAESYEATGKIKEAIQQYEKLTKLDPEYAGWYRKLGDLYHRVDRKIVDVIESNGLSLDGDGSYVEIDDSEIINNISEQVTISAWIKPTDFPNTCMNILFKGNKRQPDITHRQFTLWLFDEGNVFFDTSPGGRPLRYIVSEIESIQKDNWYHVAATIDAKKNTMKLYLNGLEVARNSFSNQNHIHRTTLPFRIGCSHEEERSEHASFAGLIDEVRIWNIARTETQIRSDMNRQLKGDEPGLIGYWKFDTETDGRISDSSPNQNDGQLIGNAKLEQYKRPISVTPKTENLAKAVSYYEKAIELNPDNYRNYDLLAKLYLEQNQTSDAAFVYVRALDLPEEQVNSDAIIRTLYDLYSEEGQEDKRIAILEKIKPKMQNNSVLHELLGDLYKKAGEAEKAELAYAEWLKMRYVDTSRSARYRHKIAEALLKKGIFPETALKHALYALHHDTESSFYYPLTLGHAYVANNLYDDALKYYRYTLSILPVDSSLDYFWQQVEDASKNAKDKNRYRQMIDALIHSIPQEHVNSRSNPN